MNYDTAKHLMSEEMARLKAYFPYRIVWGAIRTDGAYEVGANVTKRQVNDLIRKGYQGFTI